MIPYHLATPSLGSGEMGGILRYRSLSLAFTLLTPCFHLAFMGFTQKKTGRVKPTTVGRG